MNTRQWNRKRIGLALIGSVILGGAALGLGRGTASAQADTKTYVALLYPAEYESIFLMSDAQQQAITVHLCTEYARFPIRVPPEETTIIPFPDGWQTGRIQTDRNGKPIEPEFEVWIESYGVPFRPLQSGTRMGDPRGPKLAAWGIAQNGPVTFTYRDQRD